MKQQGEIQFLIAYDHPQRHPEFYQVDAHFDLYHLTREASTRLTQSFAADFAKLQEKDSSQRN